MVPTYESARRRLRQLPHWRVMLGRHGPKALAETFPAQRRDYTALGLHSLWESDGRRADVFCRWPDGSRARPTVVLWRDVRTRLVLGFVVGRTESADLIRLAFRKAIAYSRALPNEVLVDNGRGYAGRLLSSGQPTRYRGKIRPDDPLGIFASLSIQVVFVKPERGAAKPVESWFRIMADRVDRHPEFAGSFCGNSPTDRPEEFDVKNAVPLEAYVKRLEREISFYADESHRGQGMNGCSPLQVYKDLLPHTTVRQPTKEQMRLCLLAAESVRLRQKDHRIVLLKNHYWSPKLSEIRSRGPYTARFDPEDATVPIALYDGGRFICEAPLIDPAGFRDQQAGKDHARAQGAYKKARKLEDRARRDMAATRRWPECEPETPDIPPPNVAEIFRPRLQRTDDPAEDGSDIDVDATLRRVIGF